MQDIANQVNPQMIGIIRYYGKFKLRGLQPLMKRFEFRLAKWVLNKYKKFKGSYREAHKWISELKISYPAMFYYWTVFKHV
jgi:RNA-directed DNA polymerase